MPDSPARQVRVAPSILAADFARLGEEVAAAATAGADELHLDVMDGHFVPNLTFGPGVVAAIRRTTDLPLHAHLMAAPAEPLIKPFVEAGADIITAHIEAGPNIHRTLQDIRAHGKQAGVALNPGTPAKMLDYLFDLVDRILIMTVNPGFGGQSFIDSQVEKVAAVRRRLDKDGRQIEIEVDGGINVETAPHVIAAGADILVAGTAVFASGPGSYAQRIAALRNG